MIRILSKQIAADTMLHLHARNTVVMGGDGG